MNASPVADAAAPPGDAPAAARLAINAAWFGKLRWVAAAGQLVTIAFVTIALGVRLHVVELLLLVGVTAVSNAVFAWWIARQRGRATPRGVWHATLGGLMLLDLVVLTAMLALAGGPTNPFVVFYFVNLALSGMLLPAAWAWTLNGLVIVAVGLLSFVHLSVDALRDPARLESVLRLQTLDPDAGPSIATLGGWIAFAACTCVIVNFITRVNAELRASERRRRHAEGRRARAEKLEALGTLAAGAAHELATPLSTIAVATTEALRELGDSPQARSDLELVRRELGRCRAILDRMATDSGQPTAGLPERVPAGRLIDEVVGELASADRVDIRWKDCAEGLVVLAPRVALAQALRAILQNGIDATDVANPEGRVRVSGDRLADTLRLTILDEGPGMPPDVLQRATEPFYTTKAPGSGMGLGLFLARSVIERLDGSLRLESPRAGGAMATVVLPLADRG